MLPLVLTQMEPGDDRDFMEQVYLSHHRLMYAQALRVLREEAAAQDAVSDALVALMKKISVLRGLECNKLKAYVIITVKHAAIAILRRHQREPLTETGEFVEISAPDRTDGRLLERDGVERIKDFIRRLPPQEKQIMLMRYFRDMTEEEIGREMGLKTVSVRVHLSRARKKLGQLMAGEEATE